jgi:hypothetical protein
VELWPDRSQLYRATTRYAWLGCSSILNGHFLGNAHDA